jgi:16S rRNA (cytosine967-C5)-methyltransferase
MPDPPASGVAARRAAIDALVRIDERGAYANLVLPSVLERSGLDDRDRAFVTELVYGATRMRRACDWLCDRFVSRDVDPHTRAALRLGAYQLVFLGTPPHAAVGATVSAAPPKAKGFVNAILRRVADAPVDWPDDATRLSYPDWIVDHLRRDLGPGPAIEALEAMDAPGAVTLRADGYVQDLGSQWLVDALPVRVGDVAVDLCAAPGGKATALAARGARVLAADIRHARASLVVDNVAALGASVVTVVADGTAPPVRPGAADLVLVDAPCSGLGVLKRRPDARWRVTEASIAALVPLQRALLDAASSLVRPGGHLAYSVCTLTAEETDGIDRYLIDAHPELRAVPPPDAPWTPRGRGAILLPQAAGTDGMYLLLLERAD